MRTATLETAEHTISYSSQLPDDWTDTVWHRWDCPCGMSGLHMDAGLSRVDARNHENGTGKWKRKARH